MVCDLRIHQNVFGMNEPFLFPVKRTGQPVIHLARLVKEFFGLQKGLGFLDKPEIVSKTFQKLLKLRSS